MKFFTKKAKIIFLAIILVGAILLAYNSLNHNLEYLNLNKNGLDGSAINEGFDNPQDTRHASMSSSSSHSATVFFLKSFRSFLLELEGHHQNPKLWFRKYSGRDELRYEKKARNARFVLHLCL